MVKIAIKFGLIMIFMVSWYINYSANKLQFQKEKMKFRFLERTRGHHRN